MRNKQIFTKWVCKLENLHSYNWLENEYNYITVDKQFLQDIK